MYEYTFIYIHNVFFCSQFSMSMWISFVSWAHLLRQVPTLLPGQEDQREDWAIKANSCGLLFFHALIFSFTTGVVPVQMHNFTLK